MSEKPAPDLPDIPPERQSLGYHLVADGIITPEEADRSSMPNWREPLPTEVEAIENVPPSWIDWIPVVVVGLTVFSVLGLIGVVLFAAIKWLVS